MHPVRHLWNRIFLRGVTHRDRYGQLRMLYLLRDPWALDSPREHERFEQTNQLITRAFGRPASILELGCGEGHQTEYLKKCCDRLYGVDISNLAIRRAKRRNPDCEFFSGTLEAVAPHFISSPVDMIVACEVLYYCEDVSANIALMSKIANNCFVTCYQKRADRVFPFLEAIPGAEFETIRHESHTWRAGWWRSPSADTPRATQHEPGPSHGPPL